MKPENCFIVFSKLNIKLFLKLVVCIMQLMLKSEWSAGVLNGDSNI